MNHTIWYDNDIAMTVANIDDYGVYCRLFLIPIRWLNFVLDYKRKMLSEIHVDRCESGEIRIDSGCFDIITLLSCYVGVSDKGRPMAI